MMRGIEEIVFYKTKDGNTFTDKDKAIKHSNQLTEEDQSKKVINIIKKLGGLRFADDILVGTEKTDKIVTKEIKKIKEICEEYADTRCDDCPFVKT